MVRGELTPEDIAEIPKVFHPLLRHLQSPLSAETGATVLPSDYITMAQVDGTPNPVQPCFDCASYHVDLWPELAHYFPGPYGSYPELLRARTQPNDLGRTRAHCICSSSAYCNGLTVSAAL